VSSNSRVLLLGLFLVACGGADDGTEATDPAANPAATIEEGAAPPPAATGTPAAAPAVAIAFDTAAARGERPLLREVYDWRGGGRDPFRPLVVAQAGGPEMVDLVLTSVLHQASDPSRSVAIFRDTGNNKRYTVGVGDRIGRLAVVSIDEGTATLRMNDFGTTRDQTYSLRRSEDGNP
jgi:hypothetical protein